MKPILAILCIYFTLSTGSYAQNPLNSFWAKVNTRYQTKLLTPGLSSWLYRIAESQKRKYSEIQELLERLDHDTAFQIRIFKTAYVQENGNKENLRFLFANLCGSYHNINYVVEFVIQRFENDKSVILAIKQKKDLETRQTQSAKHLEPNQQININTIAPLIPIEDSTEAQFPGGDGAYQKFLRTNIKIPDSASDISGTVVVEFTIDTSGKVVTPKIISKPLGHGLESETLRVINLLPLWLPARKNHLPINTVKRQTFVF
jgi:hypothetical protein